MPGLHDVAKMTVTGTPGTGTITLNAASTGYQTFTAAGAVDQEVISYRIDDGANWELGTGTYTASGTTLTRGVVFSSNSNALINASSSCLVSIVALAPDYSTVLISKVTTSGSQANVTFSNIPGTYTHLKIVWQARFSDAATTEDMLLQFNGDTGNNYFSQLMSATAASTPSAAQIVASANAHVGLVTAANATANFAGSGVIYVPNYAGTTFNKQLFTTDGAWTGTGSGNGNIQTWIDTWNSTAAITSIKLTDAGGGNFVNNSVVCLYGMT